MADRHQAAAVKDYTPVDHLPADEFAALLAAYREGQFTKHPSLLDGLEVMRDVLGTILQETPPGEIAADVRHRLESLEDVATWALVMYRADIEAAN